MGGSSIQNATTIVADGWKGIKNTSNKSTLFFLNEGEPKPKITITGTNINQNDIKTIKYKLDDKIIDMKFYPQDLNFNFNVLVNTPNRIILELKKLYYFFDYEFQGNLGDKYTLGSYTQNIAQGTVAEAYTSSFPLTEIDDLREYILSKGREEILMNKVS